MPMDPIDILCQNYKGSNCLFENTVHFRLTFQWQGSLSLFAFWLKQIDKWSFIEVSASLRANSGKLSR